MKTLITFLLLASTAMAVDYPIVSVRAPRPADRRGNIPEVDTPVRCEPGTDLVILHPNGSESVLVESGEFGCILDPAPSLDGLWVFYSLIPDARRGDPDIPDVTKDGADIWKVNVATGEKIQLTHQEWTPNRGTIPWSQNPKGPDPGHSWPEQEFLTHGIYNTGACPLPGGRVAFTSSRNGLWPVKGQTHPNMQLFLMDDDGKNVEQTGYLNLMGALHPTLLKDGRIIWSSGETQGHRSGIAWSLWASWPDGRSWEPMIFSAKGGGSPSAWHWQAQWGDGDIACVEYYAKNNSGFGELFGFPSATTTGVAAFGHPQQNLNPPLSAKYQHFYPFQRYGKWSATKWTFADDLPDLDGKVSMPSAAPGNTMLVNYSPGPAHHGGTAPQTPHIQSEIRLLTTKEALAPADLVVLKSDPAFNYLQPKALVPWTAIYGTLPPEIPECPDSTHPALPPGTPFGLVGTSSFYKRETAAANGLNWVSQGSNATVGGVEFDSALIDKVRILAQEPTSQTRGARHFSAVGNERLKVLGEVSLRKPGVTDADGNPDTSFLAKIPADVSFTFQLIGTDGVSLTTAQTWHQLRPGETRSNCNGCHAHHAPATEFEGTAASQPAYQIANLTSGNFWTREFLRDVKPIMDAKCVSCHGAGGTLPLLTGNFHIGDGGKVLANDLQFGYSARTSKLYTKMAEGHGTATAAEALTVGQWIDLGCQTDKGHAYGTFLDDNKPTLFVQSPRRKHAGPLSTLRFGAFDTSGLGPKSIKASFVVNGRAAGAELSDLFTSADSVYSLPLAEPFLGTGEVTVSVKDGTGNEQKTVRSFTAAGVSDCEAEKAALQAQIAALQAENAALQAKIDAAKAALD